MTGASLAQLSGFLAPFVALAGVIVAKRWDRGSQREMYPAQVIADLREEIDKLREEVAVAKKEAAEAREDTRKANARERRRDDYIEELRAAWGSPPPPPAWPEGLRT